MVELVEEAERENLGHMVVHRDKAWLAEADRHNRTGQFVRVLHTERFVPAHRKDLLGHRTELRPGLRCLAVCPFQGKNLRGVHQVHQAWSEERVRLLEVQMQAQLVEVQRREQGRDTAVLRRRFYQGRKGSGELRLVDRS